MIYGNGSRLGFSPREIDKMTLWEYAAIVTANQPEGAKPKAEPMPEDRLKALGIEGF